MSQKQLDALRELATRGLRPARQLQAAPTTLGRLRAEGWADRVSEADAEQPPLWFITSAGREALARFPTCE